MTESIPTSPSHATLAPRALLTGLPSMPEGWTPLPHLGVIRASGADATSFLQGQLSNDVALLADGGARLAAYCSPKGRVLASFLVLKQAASEGVAGDVLLICSRDLLASTLKRLSMFVLRAKVKLSDASGDFALLGVVGSSASPLAALPEQPWSTLALGGTLAGGHALRLYPAAGLARALLVLPAAQAASAAAAFGPDLPLADWQWLDVLSGVPTVGAALVDQLVPQMLNYESIGGVNFKKGCYPGQEVVARSQFRGTLKRRLYIVRSRTPLQAGQDVLHGPVPGQVTGVVVQAAALPDAAGVALVAVQIAAAQSEPGLYATVEGGQPEALTLIERPYELLQDI